MDKVRSIICQWPAAATTGFCSLVQFCRCLVVPVDETVDGRKGYQFGSPKC